MKITMICGEMLTNCAKFRRREGMWQALQKGK